MRNLYETLEVSENASNEIIDKAYKVLVKKYHPDLQQDPAKKAEAESKIKEVNEAYEILKDETKRNDYNNKLRAQRSQEEARKNIVRNNNSVATPNGDVNQKVQEAYKEAYRRAYNQFAQQQNYNSNNSYTRVNPQTYSNKKANSQYVKREVFKWKVNRVYKILFMIFGISSVILLFILFPPIQKVIVEQYYTNPIMQTIIYIFDSIAGAILSVFVK